MKLDKNFEPLPADPGDEFYPNGLFEFNITKMLDFISSNSAKFPIEKVPVGSLVTGFPQNLNEKTVETANLSNPIILGEIAPGRFNVIDGNHRLEKARRLGLGMISSRRIAAENHVAFLKTVKGYETYIEYWNSKLDGS